MPLSSDVKKLAAQALKIRESQVPMHRVLDVLATPEGDINTVINRYRDIKAESLRRAMHYCAELLRAVEREAGLTPDWEKSLQKDLPSATAPSPAAEAPSKSKSKFAPAELVPFIDESARGQVRVAKAFVDGASKGNPGESGIGVAIFTMDGKKIAQESRAIGLATNNIAEYSALIECLKMARDLNLGVLNVISDSELMVKQVNGLYKIKNADILKKVQEVMALKKGLEKFTLSYVGREYNQLADALSTAQLKKKGATKDPYRDFMGDVNPDADEGATE